jgi:hypothetical protein
MGRGVPKPTTRAASWTRISDEGEEPTMNTQASRYPSIEMSGVNLSTIAEAFRLFPQAGMKQLVRRGLASGGTIDVERWYPLDTVLAMLDEVLVAVGPTTMFEIGRTIPKNAPFPPTITDAFSALASVNVVYHMNHRKNGRPMFDAGRFERGIGEYRIVSKAGAKPVVIESDIPYPCELRHGLLTAVTARFEPRAVVHHPAERCQKRGAAVCTYEAMW